MKTEQDIKKELLVAHYRKKYPDSPGLTAFRQALERHAGYQVTGGRVSLAEAVNILYEKVQDGIVTD